MRKREFHLFVQMKQPSHSIAYLAWIEIFLTCHSLMRIQSRSTLILETACSVEHYYMSTTYSCHVEYDESK
jgi:hypothetical protein